jgi:hypothetical protein
VGKGSYENKKKTIPFIYKIDDKRLNLFVEEGIILQANQ